MIKWVKNLISLTSASCFQCYPGDFLLSSVYILIAACFPDAIFVWVKHWRHAMRSRLIVQTEKKLLHIRKDFDCVFRTNSEEPPGFR